ncbi:two component transcriptional regulator, LuxR family [Hymenobacter daecheongensis DSM 21074]|uniref:Two component transcriptional regulator, LuxR family n=1 Tax=Hymenobacter daecheongensis DSM 21074 TaxID=1121955 RepID=A0A1M6L7M4_9BACT|nr:response regulator transcription factor [Hymenobacter daecheongensis]SHJ67248.1 two component transcriptional regulator, LuxR family [Hymenobacter daecheongensis DSM 21074]
MIRIILTDDHTILREGIRALLQGEPDLQVVGEAASGQELLALLAHTPADVVLLDLNMPGMDGFAALGLLQLQYPALKVLVLSMLDHEKYVARTLESGARGYILKNADSAEIMHAIRTVAEGRLFLCTEIGLDLLRKLSPLAPEKTFDPAAKAPHELSGRELEVLKLIAEGLTNAEIADKLFTSKRTIETHRQNIIEKTQAKNTAALVKYAVNQGLIE